jgi:ketosteroid isomerase-like protein
MTQPTVRELLRRHVTAEGCREIRELWKNHSLAEDRRDIPGLLATLTEDCVYECVTTGHRWEGHVGAETFYRQLLTAFPDIKFSLTDIVIGPQGVCEEAIARATQAEAWLGYMSAGGPIEFKVVIFFPWDEERRLFRGEKIYLHPAPSQSSTGTP